MAGLSHIMTGSPQSDSISPLLTMNMRKGETREQFEDYITSETIPFNKFCSRTAIFFTHVANTGQSLTVLYEDVPAFLIGKTDKPDTLLNGVRRPENFRDIFRVCMPMTARELAAGTLKTPLYADEIRERLAAHEARTRRFYGQFIIGYGEEAGYKTDTGKGVILKNIYKLPNESPVKALRPQPNLTDIRQDKPQP